MGEEYRVWGGWEMMVVWLCVSLCLSVSKSICSSVFLFFCLSVCLSVDLLPSVRCVSIMTNSFIHIILTINSHP